MHQLQKQIKIQATQLAAAEGGETVEMMINPLADGAGVGAGTGAGTGAGAATVQNPTFQGAVLYTEPVAEQADIYDAEAEAARRAVEVEQQSSVTGASVVYAIPLEARNDVYVDDGFYAGAPGAPAASGDGNYVDDGFYISAGGAGDAAAGVHSSEIVYATPFEVADTEA